MSISRKQVTDSIEIIKRGTKITILTDLSVIVLEEGEAVALAQELTQILGLNDVIVS